MSNLKQGLYQRLQQKLSPQQIQFMKLLQIPVSLLEQRIKEEIQENPALEEGPEKEDEEEDANAEDEIVADEEEDIAEKEEDISLDEYLAICEEHGCTRREDKLQLSGYQHDLA